MGVLDIIFPKTCVSCNKKGCYFCLSCLKTVKPNFLVCPACERPSPFGQTHQCCSTKYTPDGLFSFFVYEGIVRDAIHQLKYKYVTNLEKEFWQVIKKRIEEGRGKMIILEQFIKEENPVVVPIPLHWYKQRKRGFNQSLLFAKRLSNQFNLQYSDKILVRRKYADSQTKLTRSQREQNVKGIFGINPNYQLLITNYLVIDDVWTTGATMKEATRVLKEAGAKKVWGLTIAR